MIEVKDLFAGYGKESVLHNISLKVPKGKLISIIGTNGSGKSTLLKSIVGIISHSAGDIIVDGQYVSDLSRQEIAKKVCFLPQGKNVPDMTVKQMVLHGRFPHISYPRSYRRKDKEIAHDAIKQMGLQDYEDRLLPTLSGGIRQKSYIAMSLAQETDYILLDEPTTYLDISSQLELIKTLRELAKGDKGIVTVMHDLPLAFNCSDLVVILRNGEIVACDTPENIYRDNIVKVVFGVDLQYCETENYYHLKYV